MDPKEESDFKNNISWCKGEKVEDFYLKYNGEESWNDEFYESALIGRIKIEKEDLDQKEFAFNTTFENIQAESNDSKWENDAMETDAIKKETVEVNETATKELYYCQEDSFKLDTIEQKEVYIKDEEANENSLNEKIHQCPDCPYKTSQKSKLKVHGDIHKSKKEKVQKKVHQWLHCPECSFKTSVPSLLRYHVLSHKSDAFKCSECSYQSRTKQQLTIHQVKHESRDKWYSCPLCPFKTYRKSTIRTHSLRRHGIDPKNPKRIIKTFKCTECLHEFRHKFDFKKHQLIHDQSKWLKCPNCAFKTPHKNSLKKHQLLHQEENVKCWHRCLECSYKTLEKYQLRQHLISHKSADEVQWFECSQCSFKTAYKRSLRQHQLMHKEEHEVEWFYCYECSYKAKRKPTLATHISTHKKQFDKGYL